MIKTILKKLLPNGLINFLKKIFSLKKTLLINELNSSLNFKITNEKIIFLGSEYGGWNFLENKNLKNNYIISAGLGEDASFDIDLINKYNCKIILVDPTPRAIEHYKKIMKKKGQSRSKIYNNIGKQEIESYNLQNINNENFILIDKALYNKDNEKLKFFSPLNKLHVSHSINNYQNNYSTDNNHITVNSITLKKILENFKIKNLEMIKLDIEGAEIEVLQDMIKNEIFPKQILVEYDELKNINETAKKRFFMAHNLLIKNSYNLIKTQSKYPDFLYCKS